MSCQNEEVKDIQDTNELFHIDFVDLLSKFAPEKKRLNKPLSLLM